MPPALAPHHPISVDDYIVGESQTDIRHEYVDGQVYAMGGASDRHGLILNALAFALTPAARDKACQLFTSDMKVRLSIAGKDVFYYPDLVLSCDPADRESYYRTRPCLIVEVLSESTERIDRREKFLSYQTLPSLQAYVLIAQDAPLVEVYRRSTEWQPEYYESGAVFFDCLETTVSVADIYRDVNP